MYARGSTAKETPWTTWTWSQYRQNVESFAKALISIGFGKSDAVNIIGFNAPEWFFANNGSIFAGGIAAGIYTTNGPESCKYISEHSQAKVVIVEGIRQLAKYYSIAGDLPNLKALVVYGPEPLPTEFPDDFNTPVYTFPDFLELGDTVSDAELLSRKTNQKPNDVITLIYTSGTTGPPKAVMITHDNITWTARVQLSTMSRRPDGNDHVISYLPLSHIAAWV